MRAPAIVLLLSACSFDARVDGLVIVACTSSNECPSNQSCDVEIQRCVPPATSNSPVTDVVVEPAVARRGDDVHIRVDVDPTLSAKPLLFLRRAGSLVPLEIRGSRAHVDAVHRVDNDDVSGAFAIVAILPVGDKAFVDPELARVTFDVDPPGLVVTVDRAFASSADPALLSVRAAEPFVLDTFAFDGERPVVDVDDNTPSALHVVRVQASGNEEGTYHLASVSGVDVAGNASLAPVDADIIVDSRAPAFVVIPAFDRAVYSLTPPFNAPLVTFTLDEVADVDATLGTLALTCTHNSVAWTCTGALDSAPAEVIGLAIHAVDAAGNASDALAAAILDVLPPTVQSAGPISFVRTTDPAAQPPVALVIGSTASIPLAAQDIGADGAPEITGCTAHGPDASLLELTAVAASCKIALATAVPAGTWSVSVHVVDGVGNSADVEPGIGLVIGPTVAPPCYRLGPMEVPTCTDHDGDAAFGAGACDTATDCDDTDPIAHPAASLNADVPGDGHDDDCDGVDPPLVDAPSAWFVDASAPAGGTGKIAAPLRAIGDIPNPSGETIVYVAGDVDEPCCLDVGSVIGGFDSTWKRVGVSDIRVGGGFGLVNVTTAIEGGGRQLLDGVVIHGNVIGHALGLRDVTVIGSIQVDSAVALRLDVDGGVVAVQVNSQLQLVDSQIRASGGNATGIEAFQAPVDVIRSRIDVIGTSASAGIRGSGTLIASAVTTRASSAAGTVFMNAISSTITSIGETDGSGLQLASSVVNSVVEVRAGSPNAVGVTATTDVAASDVVVSSACLACVPASSCTASCSSYPGIASVAEAFVDGVCPVEDDAICVDPAIASVPASLDPRAAADLDGRCRGAFVRPGAVEAP